MDDFVCRLFGVGLAVPALCMQCERETAEEGRARMLFPDAPWPGTGCLYPWGDLVGPLPRPAGDQRHLRLMPGLPRG